MAAKEQISTDKIEHNENVKNWDDYHLRDSREKTQYRNV